jgi:hypothetical protein
LGTHLAQALLEVVGVERSGVPFKAKHALVEKGTEFGGEGAYARMKHGRTPACLGVGTGTWEHELTQSASSATRVALPITIDLTQEVDHPRILGTEGREGTEIGGGFCTRRREVYEQRRAAEESLHARWFTLTLRRLRR